MPSQPILTARDEHGESVPLLVWRMGTPMLTISSAPLGGGIGLRAWVVNATVPMSYRRDDPDVHLTELAGDLGLHGPGVGLLTGVDVTRLVTAADEGVTVWATVGLGAPIDASAPFDGRRLGAPRPGTINIVAVVPVRLSDAALVNAVATVTEAKAQAMRDLRFVATGTATDAVAVLCHPEGPPEQYGGPRSTWGARLARAVHQAVLLGGRGGQTAWSDAVRVIPRQVSP